MEEAGEKVVLLGRQKPERRRGLERHRGGVPFLCPGEAEDAGRVGGRDGGVIAQFGAGRLLRPGQERHVEPAAEEVLRHGPRNVEERRRLVKRAELEEPVDPGDEEPPLDARIRRRIEFGEEQPLEERARRGKEVPRLGRDQAHDLVRARALPEAAIEARGFGREEPAPVGQGRAERQGLDLGNHGGRQAVAPARSAVPVRRCCPTASRSPRAARTPRRARLSPGGAGPQA
jgi:hypothetical protein